VALLLYFASKDYVHLARVYRRKRTCIHIDLLCHILPSHSPRSNPHLSMALAALHYRFVMVYIYFTKDRNQSSITRFAMKEIFKHHFFKTSQLSKHTLKLKHNTQVWIIEIMVPLETNRLFASGWKLCTVSNQSSLSKIDDRTIFRWSTAKPTSYSQKTTSKDVPANGLLANKMVESPWARSRVGQLLQMSKLID
jgi:hypothetical protein